MSQLCCLAATLLLVTTLVPTVTKTWYLSAGDNGAQQQNLDRLRQMYLDSHRLATESMQETNMLKHLKQNFLTDKQLANGASLNQNNQVEPNEGKFLVHLDASQDKPAGGNYELLTSNRSNPSTVVQGEPKGDDGLVPIRKYQASKSNARQTSLFSGIQFPTSNPLGSNALMNNLWKPPTFPSLSKLPTLPPLPAFQPATPKPSRPPKSSIIGNTGGPMSLTNDNVVVVNVLSNNY